MVVDGVILQVLSQVLGEATPWVGTRVLDIEIASSVLQERHQQEHICQVSRIVKHEQLNLLIKYQGL